MIKPWQNAAEQTNPKVTVQFRGNGHVRRTIYGIRTASDVLFCYELKRCIAVIPFSAAYYTFLIRTVNTVANVLTVKRFALHIFNTFFNHPLQIIKFYWEKINVIQRFQK